MKLPEDGKTATPPAPAAGSADATAPETGSAGSGSAATEEEPERHVKVQIEESTMEMTPTAPKVPADFAAKVVGHYTCEMKLAGKIEGLKQGRELILWVLIGTGLLLVIGLAVYGIKMTHKVAGPLFKVSLYLAKMKDGRFDKVWNLRKGDQLVDFYDHFKTAHAGVVQMQKNDIEKIKGVIAAAEAAGAGENPTVVSLRELLARKEKSIE